MKITSINRSDRVEFTLVCDVCDHELKASDELEVLIHDEPGNPIVFGHQGCTERYEEDNETDTVGFGNMHLDELLAALTAKYLR